MTYDLLVKGGQLVDPALKLHAKKDVAFTNALVSAVGDDLPKTEAREMLNASGRISRHAGLGKSFSLR